MLICLILILKMSNNLFQNFNIELLTCLYVKSLRARAVLLSPSVFASVTYAPALIDERAAAGKRRSLDAAAG